MGIFDRLGGVINSYLNDFSDDTNRRFKSGRTSSGDPDFDAAYEELNEYLNGNKYTEKKQNEKQYSWRDADAEQDKQKSKTSGPKMPPDDLRADFEILGVPFGADEETCKHAYKKLLNIHHPDRHAGHEGNYKKATEKSAKINAAYDRIEKYRQNKK